MRRSIIVTPLALAAILVSASSSAQVSAKAMAESLFQEGRDLMQKGDAAAACPKFEQSQHLEAKLGTLLNLATCHEQIGRTASAWAEFTEASEIARREHEDKRAEFAKQHAKTLDAKLATIVLKRAAPAVTVSIAIDGRAIDGSLAGTALPLDPGKHAVEARAPGKKTWTGEVVVPPGPSKTEVAIPTLEDDATTAPAVALATPMTKSAPTAPIVEPGAVTPEPPAAPPSRGVSTFAYVGFGVAGAGLVAGAVTGIVSLSKAGDLKSACTDGQCPAAESGALSSATTFANVSNVAFGLAAVGAVVGVVSLVVWPPSKAADKAAARVTLGTSGLGGSIKIEL